MKHKTLSIVGFVVAMAGAIIGIVANRISMLQINHTIETKVAEAVSKLTDKH